MPESTRSNVVSQLQSLPVQPLNERWQLGLVSALLRGPGDETLQPYQMAICTSDRGGMMRSDLHPMADVPDAILLDVVHRYALSPHDDDSEPLGYLPASVVLSTTEAIPDAAAHCLERELAPLGVVIERSTDHPDLDAVRDQIALVTRAAEASSSTDSAAITPNGVLAFTGAACALADLVPGDATRTMLWRVERATEPFDDDLQYVALVPSAHGALLFATDDPVHVAAIMTVLADPACTFDDVMHASWGRESPLWAVNFLPLAEVPAPDRVYWESCRLPITARGTVPRPYVLWEQDPPDEPDAEDLEMLEAIMLAIAAAFRSHATDATWSGPIATAGGTHEIALERTDLDAARARVARLDEAPYDLSLAPPYRSVSRTRYAAFAAQYAEFVRANPARFTVRDVVWEVHPETRVRGLQHVSTFVGADDWPVVTFSSTSTNYFAEVRAGHPVGWPQVPSYGVTWCLMAVPFETATETDRTMWTHVGPESSLEQRCLVAYGLRADGTLLRPTANALSVMETALRLLVAVGADLQRVERHERTLEIDGAPATVTLAPVLDFRQFQSLSDG